MRARWPASGLGRQSGFSSPEELAERTDALVQDIGALAPLSLRGMKETLNDIARGELDVAKARQFQLTCLQSEDFTEGKQALAEKRPANFKGA